MDKRQHSRKRELQFAEEAMERMEDDLVFVNENSFCEVEDFIESVRYEMDRLEEAIGTYRYPEYA